MHTYTNSLKCWCHLCWPHHHFAYCGNLPRVNWLGLSWVLFVLFLRDISKEYSVRWYGKAQMNFLVNPVFFFFPFRWIECLPHASHCVRQNSNSTQPFLVLRFNLFIRWLLIPTVISIQGMDVRYSATFPVGDGHLPPGQWESHSWTQLVGFCCYQEASDLGRYSRRVQCKMPWHPALPFFYSPSFPWSNLLLHSGRGNRGSGQDSCSPRHSGSSLLSTAEAKCHW